MPVMLLLGTAFVFNAGFSLTGFYDWTYDAWSHLFFASHYMNSWFDTWDPRWFTGFSVTSYPPLVFQLLALLAFIFGLEMAYVLLNFSVMLLVPVAVYFFSVNFLTRRQATLAGLLAIVLPALYLAGYTYGQLPTVFALVSALFMGSFLWRFLKYGGWKHALTAAVLAGITVAAHHFTFICFVPVIVAGVACTEFLRARASFPSLVKRLAVFALFSAPLVILPVLPFWLYVFNASPQSPIFHASRANYFQYPQYIPQFVIYPYLMLLPAIPLIALTVIRKRYLFLLPLSALFLFLFLLGLGDSTPLPRFLFQGWWLWLTYDRFALWAGILLAVILAGLLPAQWSWWTQTPLKRIALAVALVMLLAQAAGSAWVSTEPSRRTFLPSPPLVDMAAMKEFLERPAVAQYRYITLGFGETQVEKLSTISRAYTLDGIWVSGRRIPLLDDNGIGLIDTIKFTDPGLVVLDELLSSAALYNLKWVLVNDSFYFQVLEENGFVPAYSAVSQHDTRLGSVTIWQNDAVPPLNGGQESETGLLSDIWGIAPLSLLVLLAALLAPGGFRLARGAVRWLWRDETPV